jgi:hypothetical protein
MIIPYNSSSTRIPIWAKRGVGRFSIVTHTFELEKFTKLVTSVRDKIYVQFAKKSATGHCRNQGKNKDGMKSVKV